ncbi:uncharacterized protein LOC119987861 [Tripterygium wilfordii]|uniref:uncharacterized protein LOC119987861 n=1 Tax=Tripterygium wilfordii TaxID=458696 RepID=UPI0018F81E77|nr:uncharacterized protein LOC119987861 [Tripterygium wilfordii]
MTNSVVAGLISSRIRRLFEIIPDYWISSWTEKEIRLFVLINVFFQIVLLVLGNRRKYKIGNWISIILWLVQSSVNTFTIASISIISNDESSPKYDMFGLWASFMVLHLGGTHTISAYSLEDNELGLRSGFGSLTQLLGVVYIFLEIWGDTTLNFITIPMLLVGIVKNGEMIWTHWSMSVDRFQASLPSPPNPGPNYARFMVEYSAKIAEGFNISVEEVEGSTLLCYSPKCEPNNIVPDASILRDGNYLFNIFKRLFADDFLTF